MKPKARIHPYIVVREPSPNISARSSSIQAIVLHDTESHRYPNSPKDLQGVSSWFKNSTGDQAVSCHIIVDDDGHSARCVEDEKKAWHVYLFNSLTLGIEQIGFAADGKSVWRHEDDELHETARWIAHWSIKCNIPIQKAEPGGMNPGETPRFIKPGVTTHHWLGSNGGGHSDPGAYPFADVMDLARAYKVLQLKENE